MATADGFGTQEVRRLDNLDAAWADLYSGPSVIVSFKQPLTSSDHITKHFDMPKHQFETLSSGEESSPIATPMLNPPMVTSDDFALAFDIDGVLIKGGEPIPKAVDAMKYINGENPYGIKV